MTVMLCGLTEIQEMSLPEMGVPDRGESAGDGSASDNTTNNSFLYNQCHPYWCFESAVPDLLWQCPSSVVGSPDLSI